MADVKAGRREVASRRIRNILRTHGVAIMRTLEQKISDAGPNDQRIDPHILTEVRNDLLAEGRDRSIRPQRIPLVLSP